MVSWGARNAQVLKRIRAAVLIGASSFLTWSGSNGCAVDDRPVHLPQVSVFSEQPRDAGPTVATAANGATLGTPCGSAAECGSGFCVDGVCCNSGCGDVCATCNAAGSEGTCSPLPSDPACATLQCPGGSECRGIDATQAGSNCDGIGSCRKAATCQLSNFQLGTSCENGTGTCDGNGACNVPGKLILGAACQADSECGEGHCASNGTAGLCCDAPCDGACQQCGASGHCEAIPANDPRCTPVACPPSNLCRSYAGDLSGACHSFGSCATGTDCTYTELRSPADCDCDTQGNCTLLPGRDCQNDSDCGSGACVQVLGGGKSVCCATSCSNDSGTGPGNGSGKGLSCASDGSGCVECSGSQVSCDGTTELRCQADGHFARVDCQFGCGEGQGCNPLPGLGFVCDAATGCFGGLPCQQDSGGAQRCCSRDCKAEGRICAPNGSCACPPDQTASGAVCLLHAGDPCTQAADCETGSCVDGVCCQEACDGACEQCQAGTGACVAIPAGQADSLCTGAKECTGSRGDCRAKLTQQCTANTDCASENCEPALAGGQRCCAVACTGDTSCSSDGESCVQCEPNSAGKCGNGCNTQTLTCNPLRPVGSPCALPQQCAAPGACLLDNTNVSRCCEANCAALGRVCSTNGACICPAGQSDVNGQCRSTPGQACSDNTSCSTGACSLAVGGGKKCCARACSATELCAPDGSSCIDQRGAVGAGCTTSADCQNNNCINNVCCGSTCGACQRCQQATGLCQADSSAKCALASGVAGACNVQGQCVDPGVGPGQLCGNRPCQAGLVCTSAGVCCNSQCNGVCQSSCGNGSGVCNTPATDARCGQTQCSAGQCQTSRALQTNRSCVSPGACAAPAADQCSAPTGTSGGTCTVNGGAAGQCTNGTCTALGATAGSACTIASDCATGLQCVTFFSDPDGDGFAASNATSKTFCANARTTIPNFTQTQPRSTATADCVENNADVHPGQTKFFAGPIPGKTTLAFDYNCDGVETASDPTQNQLVDCTLIRIADCAARSGWITSDFGGPGTPNVIPACGQTVTQLICQPLNIGSPDDPVCSVSDGIPTVRSPCQ